jgi:phosphohistidine phosphatase SixA
VRTGQTLEAVESSLGERCAIEGVLKLHAASEQEPLERLQAVPESASSVMLVGYNPGYTTSHLSSLRGVLTYRSSRRSSDRYALRRSSSTAKAGPV